MVAPIIEPPALYRQAADHHHSFQNTDMQKAYHDFKDRYSAFFTTSEIDALRAKEYKRLDEQNQVYLDYTGSSLYSDSQIHKHMTLLLHAIYGNPHSDNPTSSITSHQVAQARNAVLDYFKASTDEYTVIFTHNATGALKLLGESYPFTSDSKFLLFVDNHNSVNGIREFARSKGAHIQYIPVKKSNLRLDPSMLDEYLNNARTGIANLFAYPAQSNFSGVQHPLEFIARAQEKGWDVLLDAAAFVSTNELDLSQWHPDYVDISFYKIFGYPTGVGCLILKHKAMAKLKRPWFAGGTVEVVSVQGDGYYFHEGYSAYEDGTANFLSLAGVPIGLRHVQMIGVKKIHERVMILTDWLIKQLLALRHTNGTPLIRLYGPSNVRMRGGILTMNFLGPDGLVIDPGIIEHYAAQENISIRTGCFCNPGCIETINDIAKLDVEKLLHCGHPISFEEYVAALPGKTMGAVRVSLGIVSNFADVYQFVQFARSFIDKEIAERLQYCTKQMCNSSC